MRQGGDCKWLKVGIEKVITNKWIVHTELNGKLFSLNMLKNLKLVGQSARDQCSFLTFYYEHSFMSRWYDYDSIDALTLLCLE